MKWSVAPTDVMANMFDQEEEPSIQPGASRNLAHTLYPVSSTCRKVKGGFCTRKFLGPTAGGETNIQIQKKGMQLWKNLRGRSEERNISMRAYDSTAKTIVEKFL